MNMEVSRPLVCFEVEKVIGVSSDGSYQVQWAPAWVSKFHLVGCEHLIQEFLQQQQQPIHQERQQQRLQQQQEREGEEEEQQQHQLHQFENKNHAKIPHPSKQLGSISTELNDQQTLNDEVDTYPECYQPPDEDNYKTYEDNRTEELSSIWEKSMCSQNSDQYLNKQRSIEVLTITEDDINIKLEDTEQEVNEIPDWSTNNENGGIVPVDTPHSTSDSPANEDSILLVNMNEEECRNSSDKVDGRCVISLQRNTSPQDKYACRFCNRLLLSKSHLKVHLRSHTGERPHVCRYCGKGFTRKDYLKTHLRIHTGEKPFSCEHCQRTFTQKGKLNRHLRMHADIKCPTCEKTFCDSTSRDQHSAYCIN